MPADAGHAPCNDRRTCRAADDADLVRARPQAGRAGGSGLRVECAREVQDYVLTPYVFAFGVEPLDVEDAHARIHAECRGRGWDLHLRPVTSPPGRTAFCIATIHAPSFGAAVFALGDALDRFEHGRLRFLGQGP